MIVSELARQAGISSNAFRYCARIGLLKPQHHPGNGYKLFEYGDVRRLHFILQAKQLGFTLNEIEQRLKQVYDGQSVCPELRNIFTQRVEEIDQLQNQRNYMQSALQRWEEISNQLPDEKVLCPLIESDGH